jgi:hypothetical protein
MDTQTLINFATGSFIALLAWLGQTLWDAVTKLKDDLHRIELELPTSYVRKEDFSETLRGISEKLDRIYDRLDEKADKK